MAPVSNNSAARMMSSDEVSWQGPTNLEGFEFYKGLNITGLFLQFLDKLTELKSYSSLKDVDFTSLTNIKPTNLNQAITFLITAINDLKQSPGSTPVDVVRKVFNVTYKCLYNINGIQEFNSDDELIQAIINKVCENDSSISLLNAKTTSLSSSNTLLINKVVTLTNELRDLEGALTASLVSGLPVTLETFFSEIRANKAANDLKIGSIPDFENAMTVTGDNVLVTNEYGTNAAYTLQPQKVSEYLKNLGVISYDLLERVKNLEINTSLASCGDIKINFSMEFNVDRTVMTIKANNSTGTYIPDDFVDDGSYITITDAENVEYTFDVVMTNNLITSVQLNDVGLGLLLDYNVTIFHNFRSLRTSKVCSNLTTKFAHYQNNTDMASINTSMTGSAYIEFLNPATSAFENINVSGGSTYNIPANANIVMIMKTDDLVLSSYNAAIQSQFANTLPNVTYTALIRPLVDPEGISIYSHIISSYEIYKFNNTLLGTEMFINGSDLKDPLNATINGTAIGDIIEHINNVIPKHLGYLTDLEIIPSTVSEFFDIKITFKAPLLPVTPRFGLKLRNTLGSPGCVSCEQDISPSLWISSKID